MAEKVNFQPTKRLFIDVLTRDISIHDCILDLIDNSVDSFIKHKISEKRQIEINFNEKKFGIFDNCGGIDKETLEDQVFRSGISTYNADAPTIGLYGIGLKRAIFKIGKHIAFETDDGNNYCKLIIDEKWMKDENAWFLPINDLSETKLKEEMKPYTKIEISMLNEETTESFTSDLESGLKKTIQKYYTKFISKGLEFFVNNEKLERYPLFVEYSDDYEPIKKEFKYDDVEITLYCWIQPKKETREKGKTGWNIFMNDRLILDNDISKNTGWRGEKPYLPKFHPIYNQFRGIVFLNSKNPNLLPMNTSKNMFNTESFVYNKLINEMCDFARPLIDFLSEKYTKEKEEVDEKENSIYEPKESNQVEIKSDSLENIDFKSEFQPPKKIKKAKGPRKTTISFKRVKKDVDFIKEIYDIKSNEKVGQLTFDYFWENEGLDNV